MEMDPDTLSFYAALRGPFFPLQRGRDELDREARAFLAAPHGKSRGYTRFAHILGFKGNPWRPFRDCSRNVGDSCRCHACPQCARWNFAGQPTVANKSTRCPAGYDALKAAFADMLRADECCFKRRQKAAGAK